MDSDDLQSNREARAKSERLSSLKQRAAQTRNPLYVWQAIAFAKADEKPIPEWCQEYIAHCAFEIFTILQKLCGPEYTCTINAGAGSKHLAKISPKLAAAQVTAALQITRKGYNAFSSIVSDEQAIEDSSFYDMSHFLQSIGVRTPTPEQAVERIKKRRSIGSHATAGGDDRQVRNRIRKGRALLDRNKVL